MHGKTLKENSVTSVVPARKTTEELLVIDVTTRVSFRAFVVFRGPCKKYNHGIHGKKTERELRARWEKGHGGKE
jgi:hypothetical protein